MQLVYLRDSLRELWLLDWWYPNCSAASVPWFA